MVSSPQPQRYRSSGRSLRPGSTLPRIRGVRSSTLSTEMTSSASPKRLAARRAGTAIEPSAAAASPEAQQPATIAAGRMFGASLLLGALAFASAVFVITRLSESWRVTSAPASHVVSVFGQQLSYPTANAGAIVVTVLAGLGLLMAGAAAWGLGRELVADRRFRRTLAARSPVALHGAWIIDDDRPQPGQDPSPGFRHDRDGGGQGAGDAQGRRPAHRAREEKRCRWQARSQNQLVTPPPCNYERIGPGYRGERASQRGQVLRATRLAPVHD